MARRNTTLYVGIGFLVILFLLAVMMNTSGTAAELSPEEAAARFRIAASATYFPRSPAPRQYLLGTPTLPATAVAAMPTASSGDQNALNVSTQRMVITNASLRLIVKDPIAAVSDITAFVLEIGGYVVNGNSARYVNAMGTEVPRSSLVVRVPAERFEEAMKAIKAKAVKVDAENVAGQDVTDEFTDLQSRLKNWESAEVQLRTLMEKAEKTSDVLDVYNELVRVRGEIELIKGRMQSISGNVAYSAIGIELFQVEAPTLTPTPTTTPSLTPVPLWRPAQTALNAANWFGNVLASMGDMLVWLVVIGGPFALVAGVIFRLRRAGTSG